MKHRFENFGGIISSDNPPLLVFVDRQYMFEIGYTSSELWHDNNESIDLLSAPVEVHFACTNSCSLGCSHCYMDSGKESPGVLNTEQFKKTLDTLAEMGVFHVAMGGGEALERNDLFELAAHARKIGIVPNLTTNGNLITSTNAEKFGVFGQVNLSLDGVGEIARTYRDRADFNMINRAFDILQRAGISAGINCVVGRNNLAHLHDLFNYASAREISEIELLRFKPSGRAKGLYDKHRLSPEQNRSVYPLFQKLTEEYNVKTKIDCSFIPMLVFHRPPLELLEAHCVCGCEAGNFLLGARSDGRICGCSFLPAIDISLNELPDKWNSSKDLRQYREWSQMTCEPCRSCDYLRFCKGGCHAVSLGVTGDMNSPDPDCPLVLEYNNLNEQMV